MLRDGIALAKAAAVDAIEILTAGHRQLEPLLDAFETFAGSIGAAATDGPRTLGRFVQVLQESIHAGHHALEERVLFTHLVDRGFPANAGPLAVLRAEHAESAEILGKLERVVAQGAAWTAPTRHQVESQIRAYVTGLRQHIVTEETCLFPAARAYLSDAAMKTIRARLAQQERRDDQDDLLRRIDELVGHYRTSLPPALTVAAGTPAKGDPS